MNFITVKTYEELSKKAANIIAAQIVNKPDCVLGLATGSSPVGTYDRLTECCGCMQNSVVVLQHFLQGRLLFISQFALE